jgi:hypothetical protein
MSSFYSKEELKNLNFKSIGDNNKISRNATFIILKILSYEIIVELMILYNFIK